MFYPETRKLALEDVDQLFAKSDTVRRNVSYAREDKDTVSANVEEVNRSSNVDDVISNSG